MTVGVPRSGKSTWASGFEGVEVNLDQCREIVNGSEEDHSNVEDVISTRDSLVEEAAMVGSDIVISDTNIAPGFRTELVQRLRQLGYSVDAVVFDVPLEVCLERNAASARVVPEDVVVRMYQTLLSDPPTVGEFDRVFVNNGDREFELEDRGIGPYGSVLESMLAEASWPQEVILSSD